jgi:murein L,D-transpeptidase YafK
MRLRHIAFLACTAIALTGCNDTLETVADVSHVKDKVDHPLSPKIVAEIQKKDMDRNAPIMIRIFKEEGSLEIWKAKRDNRFDKIAEYQICAWSGKLGPKVKEGDRQAPEGFYNLTPAHLNPNSNYYLAINTGFPNRFDQANSRTGSNLMIHGACSSSGCYSMTDAQVLEIYAFARDAFKGGQKTVQLQAFPFRMTAENMARHRHSQHEDFWQMLKVGYDNFEVTKRPPEVNVCDKKYVFNQQTESGSFNASATCPAMTTPPALANALTSYDKTYKLAYDKAMRKYDGMAWYDPSEAERKALVADKRKGRELAYAPTGSALKAGKLMKESEFAALSNKQQSTPPLSTAPRATSQTPAPQSMPAQAPAQVPQTAVASATPAKPAQSQNPIIAESAPAPTMNPLAFTAQQPEAPKKKPFWKLWATE